MQQNLTNEKLRDTLKKTLADRGLKRLLEWSKESWEIVGSNVSDIPYLPILEIEHQDSKRVDFLPPVTYKEEVVIREDGYFIQSYETSIDIFEEFDEVKDRFPFGWHTIGVKKISIEDIVEKFSDLTEGKFLGQLRYQMALREAHIRDYKKFGFLPHYTFMDKIEYHFANMMGKEIKWLKFLDFGD